MKIGNLMITDHDRMNLKEDLRKILEWSQRWNVPFNVNKCHSLEVGTRNQKFDYKVNGTKLEAYGASKTLALLLHLPSKSPTSAKMPQIQLTECWFL